MVYNKTEKIIEKQQNRKTRILKAAREILEKGTNKDTSIKAIAKKAGIATGTFYLYFADKETLIDTVVKEIYVELLEIIKEERSKYSDIFDKLEASMEICIKTFMKEKHLAKILLEHFPEVNNALNCKFTDIENDLIRFTKDDLYELREQNLIPDQDIQVSATAFVGTFRQVILSWINSGEPVDYDRAYKTLIQYNLRGLGKQIK
ncbi:MAG: TetR/AcrR family transcriptional regulator [Eubacteriales bacterium]